MARTSNTNMTRHDNYDLFYNSVKAAIRAGFYGCIISKVTIPVVATISTGIYAGRYRQEICKDFLQLVRDVLNEYISINNEIIQIYNFFNGVIIPILNTNGKDPCVYENSRLTDKFYMSVDQLIEDQIINY